ncbi:pentapeptide repeat-containing protein [Inquilinus sp. YAF38]|uniref:pentapeptide repeat-containing protein n=1 Tax=Inquilinus sp. YAF38 TaxID=3233084 RepID=UPI003F91AF6D
MMSWLASAETYLGSRSNLAIALIAAVVLLALIAWVLGPVLLTAPHRYETRKERSEDSDRYRRNIGQLLIVPVLMVAALYTLYQVNRAAREGAANSRQEQYSQGFEALASFNISTRLIGLHALAQLMGGNRPDDLCPDGNQRPLSGAGTGDTASGAPAGSAQDQIYRVALDAIAAHAVVSSHLAPTASDTDAGHRAREEASHEATVGADTQAALSVIARRRCEAYTREVPLNLSDGYFRGTSMAYAQLIRSDLRGSDLSASELYLANFYQSNLDKADFGGSNLTRASFANASLTGADFSPDQNLASPYLPRRPYLRTQLGRAQIVSADVQGADFWCAMLNEARLDDSQLGGADFRHATLSRATLLGAKGAGAKFNAACGPRANFSIASSGRTEGRKSNFSGADFSDGFFRSARFDRIDLRGGIFVRADLTGATFENSDLTNADFRGANLTGAKFDGANLTGVRMGGALICDVSGLPDTIAPQNCAAQFLPIEAGRYGEGCFPETEAGIAQNQQCPYERSTVEMAEPQPLNPAAPD